MLLSVTVVLALLWAVVVDGCIAMVGSYNFDLLSERRNSEVALVVTDSAFAAQVSHSIAIHRSQSRPVQRGEIFLMEANESNASREDLQQLRRMVSERIQGKGPRAQ